MHVSSKCVLPRGLLVCARACVREWNREFVRARGLLLQNASLTVFFCVMDMLKNGNECSDIQMKHGTWKEDNATQIHTYVVVDIKKKSKQVNLHTQTGPYIPGTKTYTDTDKRKCPYKQLHTKNISRLVEIKKAKSATMKPPRSAAVQT